MDGGGGEGQWSKTSAPAHRGCSTGALVAFFFLVLVFGVFVGVVLAYLVEEQQDFMETVQLKGLKYDSSLQSINSGYYIVLSSILKSKVGTPTDDVLATFKVAFRVSRLQQYSDSLVQDLLRAGLGAELHGKPLEVPEYGGIDSIVLLGASGKSFYNIGNDLTAACLGEHLHLRQRRVRHQAEPRVRLRQRLCRRLRRSALR
ncbi:unnamed protein product [Tetraodon nigroviridis]|uniref:Chromosome 1 SCAF14995, whole genome shotgun sequence n=1 Tax=Tetraodon nigroviridis TaxID=99883 RepID=Q4RUA2_TETNG|nr:unnamed protein product [Tetraodon nigroviridis]